MAISHQQDHQLPSLTESITHIGPPGGRWSSGQLHRKNRNVWNSNEVVTINISHMSKSNFTCTNLWSVIKPAQIQLRWCCKSIHVHSWVLPLVKRVFKISFLKVDVFLVLICMKFHWRSCLYVCLGLAMSPTPFIWSLWSFCSLAKIAAEWPWLLLLSN